MAYFLVRLDAIAMDSELQEKPFADLKKVVELIKNGCEKAMKEHLDKTDIKEEEEPGNCYISLNFIYFSELLKIYVSCKHIFLVYSVRVNYTFQFPCYSTQKCFIFFMEITLNYIFL